MWRRQSAGSGLTDGLSDVVEVELHVLVGFVLGWLDGIPLTFGLSDGVEEGSTDTLGPWDGWDDGAVEEYWDPPTAGCSG